MKVPDSSTASLGAKVRARWGKLCRLAAIAAPAIFAAATLAGCIAFATGGLSWIHLTVEEQILIGAVLGSLGGLLSSMLDHQRYRIKEEARTDVTKSGVDYLCVRIPISVVLGVLAGFVTLANLPEDANQIMVPLTAFAIAYVSDVMKMLKPP